MARKRKSSVPLWVRLVLLIPLPVIALLVYWAGQKPREGLFESAALSKFLTSAAPEQKLRLPLHLPQSGFLLADTLQVYTSENLYEKINGHDVAFFRFGFISLTFTSYAAAKDVMVDVYAYRMDRRENALGIYAAERSDQRENLEIVDAGYKSGGAVFFYRGPYYIQVIPSEPSAVIEGALAEIIDSLSRLIPAPSEPLAALGRFPPEGRIENSDGYYPDEAFGTDFVGEVFTTQYRLGDKTVTVFRHQSDTAKTMFERYREFLNQSAEPKGTITVDQTPVYRYADYGEKVWIFAADGVFAGLMGGGDDRDFNQLTKELLATIHRANSEE